MPLHRSYRPVYQSHKVYMAASSKEHTEVMCFFLTFLIVLAAANGVIVQSDRQFLRPRFDTKKWLKEYEIINITIEFVSEGSVACYLKFSYNKDNYNVGLVKTDVIKKSTAISVDGDRIDTNAVSKQLNFYRGVSYKNDTYIDYTILITKYGLDGILKLGNDKLIIEPMRTASRMRKQAAETFPCIMYKPEDMININDTVSFGMVKDEIFASVKSTPISKQKRNTFFTDCSLHLVADHTFYTKVGNEDIMDTISEMVYLVTEANTVFRSTDFDGDGFGDNIGFHIAYVSIFTGAENYKMTDTSLTVYEYLDTFSQYDFSYFCLAVAFSCRDFEGGVLGLAWVANSNTHGAAGGICQSQIKFDNMWYSLNTNIITLYNNGERIPVYKSALTLTHEFGHSFGSPHDDVSDSSCVPNDEFGNYLMYPYANDGSKPNHNRFSACSKAYILPVLRNKGTCFTSSSEVCGNGIKEKTEECDCGHTEICDKIDPCCTPADATISVSKPDRACTIRRADGYGCSRTSPCCTPTCQFSQPENLCRRGGDCVKDTYCSGESGECPHRVFEPDGKPCNNNRKTCQSGKCIGSICTLFNALECECAAGVYECYLCCLFNNNCMPVYINDTYIQKAVGSACLQMRGFCDKTTRCVLQDPESVMKRLNQVFSPESMNEVGVWMRNHWYYVIGCVAAFLFIGGVFVATCRQQMNVHTSAYMYGQFMRIHREAEIQKSFIENRQKLVKSKVYSEIEKIKKGTGRMSLPKAVARLKVFFPTVPYKEIEKSLKLSSNEEMAVRLLLFKGYPLRRITRPVYLKSSPAGT